MTDFKEMSGFLRSERLTALSGYLRRGRQHGGLGITELREEWLRTYRMTLEAPGDMNLLHVHQDFDFEFEARGLQPPLGEVLDESEAAKPKMLALFELLRNDPERWEAANCDLRERLAEYFASLVKGTN